MDEEKNSNELRPSVAEENSDQSAPRTGIPQPPASQSVAPQTAAPVTKITTEKWYQKTWVVILSLILFWPLGLILMWLSNWEKRTKVILTIVICFLVFVALNTGACSGSTKNSSPSSSSSKPSVTQTETSSSSSSSANKVVSLSYDNPPAVGTTVGLTGTVTDLQKLDDANILAKHPDLENYILGMVVYLDGENGVQKVFCIAEEPSGGSIMQNNWGTDIKVGSEVMVTGTYAGVKQDTGALQVVISVATDVQ